MELQPRLSLSCSCFSLSYTSPYSGSIQSLKEIEGIPWHQRFWVECSPRAQRFTKLKFSMKTQYWNFDTIPIFYWINSKKQKSAKYPHSAAVQCSQHRHCQLRNVPTPAHVRIRQFSCDGVHVRYFHGALLPLWVQVSEIENPLFQ